MICIIMVGGHGVVLEEQIQVWTLTAGQGQPAAYAVVVTWCKYCYNPFDFAIILWLELVAVDIGETQFFFPLVSSNHRLVRFSVEHTFFA